MKKIILLFVAVLFSFQSFSQDTFSIIAVDPATGEVGSAGASCVTGIGAQGIIDIINDIIPGRGGVNSQASVCIPNVNLQNAITRMQAGDNPNQVIDWLLNNDDCSFGGVQDRQYGVADLDTGGNPRTAGFTGTSTLSYAEDRQGATYSVQGNILLDQSVIDNMEDNFNNTTGTLADKLMAALQGANFAGADSRCLAAGTSSTTAYLQVFKANDDPNDPYLRLNVGEQASGIEPIDILQDLYDDFLLSTPETDLAAAIRLFPNPATNQITIAREAFVELQSITIYNIEGKIVFTNETPSRTNLQEIINISSLQTGAYFLQLNNNQGTTALRFVKR